MEITLPPKIIRKIVSYLPVTDKLAVWQVNRGWRSVASQMALPARYDLQHLDISLVCRSDRNEIILQLSHSPLPPSVVTKMELWPSLIRGYFTTACT